MRKGFEAQEGGPAYVPSAVSSSVALGRPTERLLGKANGQDWLRLSEAATALGVSLNTLRRWSDTGKLVCYRSPCGHRRYRRADVEALLRAQSRQVPPAIGTGLPIASL